MLGLDDKHVARESRAGRQGAVALRLHMAAAIGAQHVAVELVLGHEPFIVAV
jgi:hypothetical protein